MTSLRYPPTLASLLEDEQYYTYFCRIPKLLGVPHGEPFMVIAQTQELRWKRGLFASYADAVEKVSSLIEKPSIRDAGIISRRRIFKEPLWHEKTRSGLYDEWCGRCRRSTLYRPYYGKHPALINAPVIIPDAIRCFFCGGRKELVCSPTVKRKAA